MFPQLLGDLSDLFALPLTNIYNEITKKKVWPVAWKREYVTPIPKKVHPESMNDLRNISCTALTSKIYESYVLEWLGKEVSLKSNQFGGTKGCSVDHLLCGVWHEICTNLEDSRAATLLTAIDYSKAFNRLSYRECLQSLARLGASSQMLQILGTFLSNRTMTLRVGEAWSNPRNVNGGVPQGSLLGLLLFNAATDDLESGPEVHDQDALLPEVVEMPPQISDQETSSSSEDDSQPTTSTPVTLPGRQIAGDPFGTPSRRDIHIRNNLLFENSRFEFLPAARNTRRLFGQVEGEVTVPPEPPTKQTTWAWKKKNPRVMKYVDDGTILSKVNMAHCESERLDQVTGKRVKVKRDLATENIFRRTVCRAESRGMKVNLQKTALLAISDATSYEPEIYIQDARSEVLRSENKTVRILGFNFDGSPTVKAQTENIIGKIRRRLWVLRHLRKFGLTEEELVMVYKSTVRSVIEFTAVVYHPMLTNEQSDELERLQMQALKCIYGLQFSYRVLLQMSGLETLKKRREEMCDKFAQKCLEGKFKHWFPKKEGREGLRGGKIYVEEYARTERLKNSPIYYMRRRLNALAGK